MNWLIYIAISLVTIEGQVIDSKTNRGIPFADVWIEETRQGTSCDEEGRFSIEKIKPGVYHISTSSIGYKKKTLKLTLGEQETKYLLIGLVEDIIRLKEVVVTPGTYTIKEDVTPGKGTMSHMDVVETPGGAADIFWAIQALPGVGGIGDNAVISIQGGDPDEVGVWVNGMTFPRPYHFESTGGGLFSFIDEALVKDVNLYTGGFPVKFGNKLSGALEINLRREGSRTLGGEFDINMSAAHLLLNGSNFWLSGSKSFIDLLAKIFKFDTDFTVYPTSWDLQGVFPFSMGKNSNLTLFLLSGGDEIGVELRESGFEGEWHSISTKITGGAEYISVLKNWTLRTTIGGEYYKDNSNLGTPYHWIIKDKALSLRQDVDKQFGRHLLSVGIEGRRNYTELDFVVPSDSFLWREPTAEKDTILRDLTNTITGGYIQDRIAITERLFAEVGIRMDYTAQTDEWVLNPRGALSFRLAKDWTFRIGGGRYSQFPGGVLIDSIYGNPELKSSYAYHSVASLEKRWSDTYSSELQVFKKWYKRLPLNDDVLNYTNEGYGSSYGFQVLIRRYRKGRFWGWISYTYTDSKRKFLNATKVTPGDYDIRHILTIVGNLYLPYGLAIGSKLRYATGLPYTPLVGREKSGEYWVPIYAERNSGRLPNYLRWDMRLTFIGNLFKRSFISYIEALNVLNHKNVIDYVYNEDYTEKEPIVFFGLLIVGGVVFMF